MESRVSIMVVRGSLVEQPNKWRFIIISSETFIENECPFQ